MCSTATNDERSDTSSETSETLLEPDGQSPVSPSGVVTVLFSDIAGSTELLGSFGDEAYELVRRGHLRMLENAVHAAGGTLVKHMGDGVMAVFAGGVDALTCAVEIQRGVARLNRSRIGTEIGVRIGVHAGEVTSDGADYFGTPVVVARRLCDAAAGGEILTSRLVAELVGRRRGLAFVGVGPLSLRGLAHHIDACRVPWSEPDRLALPPAVAQACQAAFVGRRHEAEILQQSWQRARRRMLSVVLVSGEPGIGKTALASQAAASAGSAGALVLFGHCDEESPILYQPFVEALTRYVESTANDALAPPHGSGAMSATVLAPLLRLGQPAMGLPATGRSDTERYRLFEAFAGFLETIAAEAPAVLLFDDLHWADRPTLQLLQYLVRRCPNLPILVIGTYRDTELTRTHPLAETLVDLRRNDTVERVSLRGITADDVVRLTVPEGDPRPPDVAFAEAVWRGTEGNPLFLREMLRHLEETGAIVRGEGGRVLALRQVALVGLPEGVKDVIIRRLAHLPDDTIGLLRAASVIGREFDLDVVAEAAGRAADDALDVLDAMTAAGIVEEVEGNPGRYAFTHVLIRQVLYDELSLTRRVLWHRRIGEAMEAVFSADVDQHLSEVAYHFCQSATSGTGERAVAYCRRAAEADMNAVGFEEAARHLSMAVEAAEIAGMEGPVRNSLLLARGSAEWRAGYPTARTTFGEAAQLSRDLDDARALANAALGFAGVEVRPTWVGIGVADSEAIALLEEALAALTPGEQGLRALLLSTLARELYWQPGTRARRLDLSDTAVAMARSTGDERILAQVLCNRCLAVIGPEDLDQQRAVTDEIIELGERLGDEMLSLTGRGHRVVIEFEAGDLRKGTEVLASCAPLVQRLHDPILLETFQYGEATLAEFAGRVDDAEELRRSAFRNGQAGRDRNSVVLFMAGTAPSLRRQGRAGELIGQMPAFVELYPLVGYVVRTVEMLVYMDAGDRDRVRAFVAEVDLADPLLPVGDLTWPYFLATMAEAAWFLDDPGLAARVRELLLPYRGRFACIGHMGIHGPVELYLSLASATLGLYDEAVTDLDSAEEVARRVSSPVLRAEVRLALARIVAKRGARGDEEDARRLAALAEDEAVQLGLWGVAAKARALRRSPGRAVPEISAPTRLDRQRSRLTIGARSVMGRLIRDREDPDLVQRFASPLAQRSLLAAMARSFQASVASGFEGAIDFEIVVPVEGRQAPPPDWWTIEVKGRKAAARRGPSPEPIATIRTSLPNLVRMVAGTLVPIAAVIEGLVQLDGDILVASRVPEMFGGLSSNDAH